MGALEIEGIKEQTGSIEAVILSGQEKSSLLHTVSENYLSFKDQAISKMLDLVGNIFHPTPQGTNKSLSSPPMDRI